MSWRQGIEPAYSARHFAVAYNFSVIFHLQGIERVAIQSRAPKFLQLLTLCCIRCLRLVDVKLLNLGSCSHVTQWPEYYTY